MSPSPFICECGAIRDERPAEDVEGSGALCAGGADDDAAVDVEAFIVMNVEQRPELKMANTQNLVPKLCKIFLFDTPPFSLPASTYPNAAALLLVSVR